MEEAIREETRLDDPEIRINGAIGGTILQEEGHPVEVHQEEAHREEDHREEIHPMTQVENRPPSTETAIVWEIIRSTTKHLIVMRGD